MATPYSGSFNLSHNQTLQLVKFKKPRMVVWQKAQLLNYNLIIRVLKTFRFLFAGYKNSNKQPSNEEKATILIPSSANCTVL